MGLQYYTCARSSYMLTRDNMEASLQPCIKPLLYPKVSCEVATDYEFCKYICVSSFMILINFIGYDIVEKFWLTVS